MVWSGIAGFRSHPCIFRIRLAIWRLKPGGALSICFFCFAFSLPWEMEWNLCHSLEDYPSLLFFSLSLSLSGCWIWISLPFFGDSRSFDSLCLNSFSFLPVVNIVCFNRWRAGSHGITCGICLSWLLLRFVWSAFEWSARYKSISPLSVHDNILLSHGPLCEFGIAYRDVRHVDTIHTYPCSLDVPGSVALSSRHG